MYKNKNFLTFFCGKYLLFTIIIFFGVFFFTQNVLAALCQDLGGLCGGVQSGSNRCGEGKFEISQEASNSCGGAQVCCKTGTRPPGSGTSPGPASNAVRKVIDKGGEVLGMLGNGLATPFLWVFNTLLLAVYTILGILLVFAGILFNWAINPNNFAIVVNNEAVYQSWQFIRDILNIFFILFLLFAAFATVFQIEKYNYKKVLLHLVIMALLTNFSFPISRFIIDASNVLFYGILSLGGFEGGGLSSAMADAGRIWKIAFPSVGFWEGVISARNVTAKLIFSNIFLFIAGMTFLVIAALFVIRIAVLTLLIIFSPVGFVAGIFPGTKQFSDKWWGLLINQAFFAPVMALVLVVALNVMNFMNSKGALQRSIDLAVAANSKDDYSPLIVSAMTTAIPLTILWVGLGAAKSFGAIGADIVMKYVDPAINWFATLPLKGAWGATKWGGRKAESKMAENKYLKYLTPSAVTGAFKSWSEASKHDDQLSIDMAKGEVHNDLNKLMDKTIGRVPILKKLIHKDRGDYAFLELNRQKDEELDELKKRGGGEINEDLALVALEEAINEDNQAKAVAALDVLSKEKGLENLVQEYGAKYGVGTTTFNGATGLRALSGSSGNYQTVMHGILGDLGVSEQMRHKFAYNFGETSQVKGDWSFGKLSKVNLKTGQWSNNTKYASDATAGFKKVRAQARQDNLHPRSLFEQYVDGSGNRVWGDLHMTGLEIAGAIDSNDVKSATRSRADLKEAVRKVKEAAVLNPGAYPAFVSSYRGSPQFKAYVDELAPGPGP